ncbi:MAG: C2H2-type zinc finger protein [Endozoicomonadaceae bacterium]|nr:C2H2-type zinc finger protein [Endozoicomonadaceae bacterium]
MNSNCDINHTSTYAVSLSADSANRPSASSSPENTYTNPERLSTGNTFFIDHGTQLQTRKATTADLQISSDSIDTTSHDSSSGSEASTVIWSVDPDNQPESSSSSSSSSKKLLGDSEVVSYCDKLLDDDYLPLSVKTASPTDTPITSEDVASGSNTGSEPTADSDLLSSGTSNPEVPGGSQPNICEKTQVGKKRNYSGQEAYRCYTCGKHFERKGNLTRHLKIHITGISSYQCDICKQYLASKYNLERHMLIHTGEQPFQCGVCGKGFNQNCHLMEHRLIHTGETPFQCGVCGKGFSQSNNLKRHMPIHTGEKPFQCGVCDKDFLRSSNLKRHMRIHTGEQHYKCEICGKSFAYRQNFTRHMRIHAGE